MVTNEGELVTPLKVNFDSVSLSATTLATVVASILAPRDVQFLHLLQPNKATHIMDSATSCEANNVASFALILQASFGELHVCQLIGTDTHHVGNDNLV